MLGAFTGNSLGLYLEFERGNVEEEKARAAMEMPGGGPWGVQPGQVTDDSELAMCLMRGLLAGQGKFDMFQVALYYGYWIKSEPVTIVGLTR